MASRFRIPSVVLALAAMAVGFPATVFAQSLRQDGPGPLVRGANERISKSDFVPGEVIVRFENGTTPSGRLQTRRAADVAFERSLAIPRAQVLDVEGGVMAAVERLERQPNVLFAQPNYRYEALAVDEPNDTFFGELWGLQSPAVPDPGVNALEAWESSRGGGQVIAVADTGVALDHPDLAGNLWTGPGGIHGHDFVDDDSDPDDYDFHGTHVAGTAAAIDDNDLGIAGVAPDAEIMAVRVLDGNGSGSSADIGAGIAFAAQNGADVINLSLGGDAETDSLMSAGIAIADQLNAVVVAAAGNDGKNNDNDGTVPCNLPHPNVICVAAVTESGALAGFSNFGSTTVDVGAPGTGILSAKTDYGSPVYSTGFDGAGGMTDWVAFNDGLGAVQWGQSTTSSQGSHSAADSPASGQGYAASTDAFLAKNVSTGLTGERGCRMHFDARYDIEPETPTKLGDALLAGAVDTQVEEFDGDLFDGTSSGFAVNAFVRREVSISDFDDRDDVHPAFILSSDGSVQRDGAFVDRVRVICRDDSYDDTTTSIANYDEPGAGSYVSFSGTSMATPHVAGVAALVRAAALAAGRDSGPQAVVAAIKSGGVSLESLAGKTVTGCTVDAAGAIAVALGFEGGCDSSSQQPANPDPTAPAPPPVAPPSSPSVPSPSPPSPVRPSLSPTAPSWLARPDLRGARKVVRVSRKRVLRYVFKATPGVRGRARFRTRVKALVPTRRGLVRRHLTLARPRFTVRPTGKVVLRIRLSRKELRILRRNKRLFLKVTVAVRDEAGRRATAARRLRLLAPRRR